MPKYAINVREELSRIVIVEAKDINDATLKVKNAIDNCKIILDADDYRYREIVPCSNWKDGKVPIGEDISFYYHLNDNED